MMNSLWSVHGKAKALSDLIGHEEAIVSYCTIEFRTDPTSYASLLIIKRHEKLATPF
jgi:hypothetical protein